MDPDLYDAIMKAALETVVDLLKHPDPRVRLDTAMSLLQGGIAYDSLGGPEFDEQALEETADVHDMAELYEFNPGNPAEEEEDLDEEALARRQALASVLGVAELDVSAIPDGAMLPATEENMEAVMARLAQADLGVDAPVESMPAGYRSGNSGVGSGENKRPRGRSRKRHGRR